MSSVLQPFMDELNTELTALRQEIRTLSIELDTRGAAAVMGPAIMAGKLAPTELADRIKADEILGSDSIADDQTVLACKNVRKLMDYYSERVAKIVCLETKTIIQDNCASTAAARATTIFGSFATIEKKASELVRATLCINSWCWQNERIAEAINSHVHRIAEVGSEGGWSVGKSIGKD